MSRSRASFASCPGSLVAGGPVAALILCILGGVAPATAQTLTQEEALRTAFPEPARVERHTAFLGEEEIGRVRALAGEDVRVERSVVTYYVGFREEEAVGVAYFDAHIVRSLPEVLMIVVTPEATVERIEVLKFSEPPEYRPPDGWLEQFHGRELSEELSRGGDIVNLTGATLTTDAVTRASRRILALHRVIDPLADDGRGKERRR